MSEQIYREKSLERIASPEELNDYLHVTNPAVWLIMAAVIILLAGLLVWSSAARIDSYAAGTAIVREHNMHILFDNEQLADNVETGMTVTAGETQTVIASIGTDEDGELFATAPTALEDGNYPVKVLFRQTQILSLLFD